MQDQKRIMLTVDGEPWRLAHPSIIKTIEKKEDFEALELKGAKRYALKRLAARNTSSFELKTLLKERLVTEKTIEKVVAECVALGYIDDASWIEAVVRREARAGKGARWIFQKLLTKGVPEEIASRAAQTGDEEHLERLIQKERAKGKEREKIIASLLRRGFEWSQIHQHFTNCREID